MICAPFQYCRLRWALSGPVKKVYKIHDYCGVDSVLSSVQSVCDFTSCEKWNDITAWRVQLRRRRADLTHPNSARTPSPVWGRHRSANYDYLVWVVFVSIVITNYLYIVRYDDNNIYWTRAHVRGRNNHNNNNYLYNIMAGIKCRKLLVKKPVKRIRCARVPIDRLFSGRAHQNHNIVYNPSIFALAATSAQPFH